MKKKILLSALLSVALVANVFAAGVVVNNEKIDTEAVIIEGRTLVPVRGVFEKLGFNVEWNSEEKTAILSDGTTKITITNGKTTFDVNGKEITPDVAQQIINSRFYLPLRAISEAVGADVEWNSEEKTAIINYNTADEESQTETVEKKPDTTDKIENEKPEISNQQEETENTEAENSGNESGKSVFGVNMKKTDNYSYIYTNDDGTYNLVTASDRVYVQHRDADFNLISEQNFRINGDKFAGYYYDGSNHYVVSANDKNSKSQADIYMIDKYMPSGQRKGSTTKISNDGKTINIERTLLTGGLEMQQNGSILSMVDSIESKENNEQRNVLINYNMDKMTASLGGYFGVNYKLKDYPLNENRKPYVDYGHENYISLCWKTPDGIKATGTEYTNVEESGTVYMFETYAGKLSKNNNITLDGFDVSKSDYIVAGTSVTQDENFEKNTDQNVFISSLSKTQLQQGFVRTKFVTEYKADDNVNIEKQQLVKISDDSFVLLWQESKNGKTTVKYTSVNGDGTFGEIKENGSAKLSNCKPVYDNGKLVWFYVEKDGVDPVFCTVDL